MNRQEAIKFNKKTYNGKPCKYCGNTERFVSSFGCANAECYWPRAKETNTRAVSKYNKTEKGKDSIKRRNDSEAHKKARINWERKNPNAHKEYYKNNPEIFLKNGLKKYGITVEDYNRLLIEQNYSCGSCGKHMNLFKKRLAVDHNHETKIVRGLLCIHCNTALGHLFEDFSLINKLVKYMEKF